MMAYGFMPDFVDMVVSGEKRLTLRRPRTAPARHAQVGDVIGLWRNWRQPRMRKIAVGLVVIRAQLALTPGGLGAILDMRTLAPLQGDVAGIEGALMSALRAQAPGVCAPDAFARFDGFENWAAAWAWHDARRTVDERGARALVRDLIAWRLLHGEAALSAEAAGRIDAEAAA